MNENYTKKKCLMNMGSIASALGLMLYFVGQGFHLPQLVIGAVTLVTALISLLTVFQMVACRQDGGKEVVSGNRIVGQIALTVLLGLASAVMLQDVIPFA